MRYREIEIVVPKGTEHFPDEMECPACLSIMRSPEFICEVCHAQAVFIEEE